MYPRFFAWLFWRETAALFLHTHPPTQSQPRHTTNFQRTTKSQTDAATSKTKQTNKPVHLTNVQTNRRRKEQDQKMPRKSARKINPDGVADPLATQDEDQAALDAGEVSG
jgi:hypothetical protein